MRVMIDKFFLAELQERGYVFDYKKLTEIYRASRKRPECVEHRKRREAEIAWLLEDMEKSKKGRPKKNT